MNNMLLALEITALGMGLVFGAILVLWGMMNLLTAVTADREGVDSDNGPDSDSAKMTPDKEDELKAQVAAVAVAIALAEQQTCSAHPLIDPPAAIVSAWQLGMRTRQMYQKGSSMRRRAR